MLKDEWEPKYDFPNLSNIKYIGLDTETYDPNLDSLGPGAMRKDGYLVGISIYFNLGDYSFKNYYPLRHKEGGNMPLSKVVKWLQKELANPNLHVIGANIIYDLEWLWTEGIRVAGPVHDVAIRDALIDENQRNYDLDSIAIRCGLEGKDETLLIQECKRRGWNKEDQIKGNLHQLHSRYVGPYAEADAVMAYLSYFIQQPFIDRYELNRVDKLESRLTKTLFKMWERGIPVDLDQAEKSSKELRILYDKELDKIREQAGFFVDVWSGKQLGAAYDSLGLGYIKTEKGNPSFKAGWLEVQDDVFSQSVLRARQFDRSGSVFIDSKIIKASVNGRIHPNFKQTKTEDGGGTKSGRLSSSNPNLQQVPARNEELSRIIRSIFKSDTGTYGVFDYSQQEPRVGVHFAYLRGFLGAAEAVRKYVENPRTDYHQLVADMCENVTGVTIGRKAAKTINLGLAYGMGGAKLCRSLGLSTEWVEINGTMVEVAGPEGKKLLDTYNKAVPFVKLLSKDAMNLAKRRGYVKTILGRRCNFPRGLGTHKAANRIIQGTSADMIKQAIINLDDAGYLPYNTVHDEVNNPINSLDDCRNIRDIMLHAIELEVPLLVDVEIGDSWGTCKEVNLDIVISRG